MTYRKYAALNGTLDPVVPGLPRSMTFVLPGDVGVGPSMNVLSKQSNGDPTFMRIFDDGRWFYKYQVFNEARIDPDTISIQFLCSFKTSPHRAIPDCPDIFVLSSTIDQNDHVSGTATGREFDRNFHAKFDRMLLADIQPEFYCESDDVDARTLLFPAPKYQ